MGNIVIITFIMLLNCECEELKLLSMTPETLPFLKLDSVNPIFGLNLPYFTPICSILQCIQHDPSLSAIKHLTSVDIINNSEKMLFETSSSDNKS